MSQKRGAKGRNENAKKRIKPTLSDSQKQIYKIRQEAEKLRVKMKQEHTT